MFFHQTGLVFVYINAPRIRILIFWKTSSFGWKSIRKDLSKLTWCRAPNGPQWNILFIEFKNSVYLLWSNKLTLFYFFVVFPSYLRCVSNTDLIISVFCYSNNGYFFRILNVWSGLTYEVRAYLWVVSRCYLRSCVLHTWRPWKRGNI